MNCTGLSLHRGGYALILVPKQVIFSRPRLWANNFLRTNSPRNVLLSPNQSSQINLLANLCPPLLY